MESFQPERPYRFHALAYTHLPVSRTFMSCAYTMKLYRMCQMLLSLGHEVYLYGAEGSDAPCTEFIQTHTLADIRKEWGEGDNRLECNGLGYNWRKTGFKHDMNTEHTQTTQQFWANAITGINQRKKPDDFLLLMQGRYQQPVADAVQLYLTCEPGIGYNGAIKPPLPYTQGPWHAFESTFMMYFIYGSWFPFGDPNGVSYDRVIPNYFDAADFPFESEKEDYFFFIGRMITRKGVWTAINTAEAVGAKLIIAGQETPEINVKSFPSHCEFIGYVGPEERARLMGKARAVFVPTQYIEPFGGVNVEAQLCGTPVITTNFGAFTDTVEHGVSGYRCDNMKDFVNAARCVSNLTPAVIRNHAERYLMSNVRFEFQKWWDDLYRLYLSTLTSDHRGQGWNYYE